MMKPLTTLRSLLLALIAVTLSACSASDGIIVDPEAIQGSYQGTLPCADCPGIDHHLALFDDNAFYLKTIYQDRDIDPVYYLGFWKLSESGKLFLQSESEHFYFQFSDQQTLRMLDQSGQAIESSHPLSLKKDGQFQPVYPQHFMRGTYRYMADVGLFTECLTGQRWKVAQLEDNRQLESSYLETQTESNELIFVTFEGRLLNEPNPDTGVDETAVVVESFKGIWPEGQCPQAGHDATLIDTSWQLGELNGETIEIDQVWHYPTLLLSEQNGDSNLSGSDGCNRIMGQYQLRDNGLRFSRLASTMMACQGTMELAQRYHEMLEKVNTWHIEGQTLRLFDRHHVPIAEFHAVPDAS